MDEGTVIMCGLRAEPVMDAIDTVTSQHSRDKRQFRLVPDYDVDNVSKKVVRIILSYTDYVNRTVWYK
jgi:UDP-N-acetylglucosamine 2-epimerase (non-hydrolysing)